MRWWTTRGRTRECKSGVGERKRGRADQRPFVEMGMGRKRGADDPNDGSGDGANKRADGGGGPDADDHTVEQRPNDPATGPERIHTVVESRDAIQRRNRIRHRLRYSYCYATRTRLLHLSRPAMARPSRFDRWKVFGLDSPVPIRPAGLSGRMRKNYEGIKVKCP